VAEQQENGTEGEALTGEETQVEGASDDDGPADTDAQKPAGDAKCEAEDWRQRAYRAAADLENFRKRVLKEKEELRKYAIEGVLKDLIPVADNMERALGHAGTLGGALADGVSMILRQYLAALERYGAKPFDPKGEHFDPQFHEAMSQLPREGAEPGTVIEVFQRGWMLHDRLVRPAMVVIAAGDVSAGPSESATSDAEAKGT
jgi:molecular chaperone GrpE